MFLTIIWSFFESRNQENKKKERNEKAGCSNWIGAIQTPKFKVLQKIINWAERSLIRFNQPWVLWGYKKKTLGPLICEYKNKIRNLISIANVFKFTVLFSERSVSRYDWLNWQNFLSTHTLISNDVQKRKQTKKLLFSDLSTCREVALD